jgi:putative copper resistance protein D
MEALGVAVRTLHLLAGSLVVGVFGFLLLVARPAAREAGLDPGPALAPLDRRLVRLGRAALALALVSGVLDLARQATVATGLDLAASLRPAVLGPLVLGTQYGMVWLLRHGVLLLAGTLLILAEPERDARDWLALRLETALLATLSLTLLGAAGHAASAPDFPTLALVADATHLAATGVWLGGLVPLAWLLGHARGLADGGPALAARATVRFSALGLGAVLVLVATGLLNAWAQVATVPSLVGTPYGRWLLLKVALLLPMLGVAAVNTLVLKPRLAGAAAAGAAAPAALVALRRNVWLEALFGLAILTIVGVLGLTTPARHDVVSWPFSFRLSWEVTRSLPGVQTRVAIGSQVALFGLVALLVAAIVRQRRWSWVASGGAAGIAIGVFVALPPLAIDAYPTTYLRPTVPYAAASVAAGAAVYREHCAVCHGLAGYGDGPLAPGLRPRPADLTAKHTADHTVGDLFWWLTHGIRGSAMPGFGHRLGAEARWDLINFLRTLAAAEQARVMGPVADPQPALVAPDFAYTPGVGEGRSLREFRGRRPVLLVFFTLPDSAPRLVALSDVYERLLRLGAEILAVPVDGEREVYRALGARPVFFPIVVDGATETVATYRLFARDLDAESDAPEGPPLRHMELLVDRPGYLRARWIPRAEAGGGWADPARLLAEVERLAREPALAAIPDEHVH